MIKKLLIDLVMLIVIILVMSFSLTGSFIHELLGIIILVIVIIHLLLNIKMIKNALSKFKNMPIKNKINYIVDVVIAVNLIAIIVTGIFISRHFFTRIAVENILFWSSIHHFVSYLEICLLGIHLGFHLDTIIRYMEIKLKYKDFKYKNIGYSLLSLALMSNGLFNMIKPAFYSNFVIKKDNTKETTINKDVLEESTNDPTSSQIEDNITDKVTLNEFLKDKFCNGCGRHCSLASPLCNGSDSYIETATTEYISIYGSESLSNNETTVSLEKLSTNESLEEYLSKLHCTGCYNNCPLSNIKCNVGVSEVNKATIEYNKLYSESESQTVEIETDNINLFGYISIISFFALGTHYTVKLKRKETKK